MSIDVLEGHVTAVAHSPAGLHGPIRRITGEPVRPVVAHRHLMGDLQMMLLIEPPSRLTDQLAQHRCLGVQLDQRELDALIHRHRLAPGDPLVGVAHRLINTELTGPERRRRLTDPVLMHEMLREIEPLADLAEHRFWADPHIGECHLGVIGRHVERPPEKLNREPLGIGRHQKRGDAVRCARLTGGAGEDDVVRRVMQT